MHKWALDVRYGIKKCNNIYPFGYILKMDISKYFENIDRNILYDKIKKKIADKKVLHCSNYFRVKS